jgi:peroxiredoxin
MTLVFYLSYAALWALVIFQSLVLLGVVRNVYRLQQDRPTTASSATMRDRPMPEFTAVDLSGEAVVSGAFAGRLTGLLFVGSDCETCALTLHDLDALHAKADRNMIVICQGPRNQCAQLAEVYGITAPVVADEDRQISDLFEITRVPTAVIVDENGQIASFGHPLGGEQLEELIATARGETNGHELVLRHRGGSPGSEG